MDKSVQAVQVTCCMCIVVQYKHKSVRPVQTGTEVCELVVSVAENGCFTDGTAILQHPHRVLSLFPLSMYNP